MHREMNDFVLDIAQYIVQKQETVRGAAQCFGCSKSSVHKYMTERLEALDPGLYLQVRAILDRNKAERHIRGDLATREKYRRQQKNA